jgi:hypothetical protein
MKGWEVLSKLMMIEEAGHQTRLGCAVRTELLTQKSLVAYDRIPKVNPSLP